MEKGLVLPGESIELSNKTDQFVVTEVDNR
jgi:hypothetical protein